MIDTIVLTLHRSQFEITNHDAFSPSTRNLFTPPYLYTGKNGLIKCVQNPKKTETKQGIYKPRLTVIQALRKGGYAIELKIEFSIPKLIFGNNFDEVQDKDFNDIINRLYHVLYSMGVIVMPEMLRSAAISNVHYSKNIPLTDYTTPYPILKELSKIDLSKRLDLNQSDFRNGGHSLKFRTNSFELTLYDKIKDLEQSRTSEKRAIERDNEIQLEFFDKFQNRKHFEVIRLEVRLTNRREIKKIFNKLSIINDLTFNTIFSADISKKILFHYLAEIKSAYSLLAYNSASGTDFCFNLKTNNPKIKISKILQFYGLSTLIKEIGMRETRNIIEPFGKHNWQRFKKEAGSFNYMNEKIDILSPLEEEVNKFTPLKIKDYLS